MGLAQHTLVISIRGVAYERDYDALIHFHIIKQIRRWPDPDKMWPGTRPSFNNDLHFFLLTAVIAQGVNLW